MSEMYIFVRTLKQKRKTGLVLYYPRFFHFFFIVRELHCMVVLYINYMLLCDETLEYYTTSVHIFIQTRTVQKLPQIYIEWKKIPFSFDYVSTQLQLEIRFYSSFSCYLISSKYHLFYSIHIQH